MRHALSRAVSPRPAAARFEAWRDPIRRRPAGHPRREPGTALMQHVWPLAKSLLKRIRFARVAANAYRNRAIRRQLSRRTAEQVITELYLSNAWGSAHSRSGPGSE